MTEYKCGDCFHAELCEKSKMIVGFSRDNPAYCGMFLNSADVAPVRHGRWVKQDTYAFGTFYDCSICDNRILDTGHSWNYCPNCGCRMDGGADHETD